jgi:hypothetical protein
MSAAKTGVNQSTQTYVQPYGLPSYNNRFVPVFHMHRHTLPRVVSLVFISSRAGDCCIPAVQAGKQFSATDSPVESLKDGMR